METLESALRSYLALARPMLSQALNGGSLPAGASAATPPEEDRLRSTVSALERQPEFEALVRRTADAFSRDEFEKTVGNMWESYVGNFFRRSGWYLKTFGNEQQDKPVEEAYRQAFTSRDVTVKYFAPLEFVEFAEDRLDFGQFQVQRFCSRELGEAFDNRMLRVFYPQSEVDSVELAGYWLVVCSERKPVSALDLLDEPFSYEVQFASSPFPPALARALRSLILCPWHMVDTFPRSIKTGDAREIEHDAGPVLPRVPFFLRASDSLIDFPCNAPNFALLSREPHFNLETGEENGLEPARGAVLNERETRQFSDFVREMAESLHEVVDKAPLQWGFMGTAFDFLLKASLSEGFEALLWYITTVDALLGSKGPGATRLLKRRIGLVLATNEEEQKNNEARLGELYDIRSELVHGNTKLRERKVFIGHLGMAREMARRAAIWMLRYLHHLRVALPCPLEDLPSREDLLAVIDMDHRARCEVAAILSCLPEGFPKPTCWTK